MPIQIQKAISSHLPCLAGTRPSFRRFLVPALTTLLATGCSLPINPARDAEFQSYASMSSRPVTRPVRSISSFSDSLMCMDKLFQEARVPTTLISSKSIPDYSTRVPVATKEMIITALSQMSRLSNAFRYVDFEVDIARQDTVQNLTTILLNNNQMQLQRPALYVSGAMSFVDQNVINNRMQLGTSATRFESGMGSNRSATVVGLELHLGDFKSRTIIPGLDSANEVIIGNGGQGLDLSGRIGKYGWDFNVGRDYALGTGAAVRTLVELAMIELTGKWARVPYWQCLTLEQTHPAFQRQLREWYESSDPLTRQRLIQRSLIAQGYLPRSEALLLANSPILRDAVARFQADQGIVVNGIIDYTTYDRVLRNFVKLDGDGNFERIGWQNTKADKRDAGSPLPEASAPLKIDLQIENPVIDKTQFYSGTPLFLSVRLSRASHLSCYHASPQGNVIRLLPNMSNPASLVSANQTIRIPDWMSPNPPFVLDTGAPGTESAICLATSEDPMKKLPAPYQVPALTLVQGTSGVEGVRQQFEQAFGKEAVASRTLKWQVLPKP